MSLLARGTSAVQLTDFLSLLTGLVGVTAGVALLVCWRIVGTAFSGWLGAGLLDLGLLRLVLSGVPAVDGIAVSGLEPLEWTIISLTAGWFIWKALHADEVDAIFSPARVLTALVGTSLIVLGGLNLLAVHGELPHALATTTGQSLARSITAIVWLALATDATRGLIAPRVFPRWTVAVVALLALAAILDLSTGEVLWPATGACVMLAALAVALGAATAQVQDLLSRQDRHQLRLHLDLDGARRKMQSDNEALEERLHDLRNAVSAVRVADSTLRRYAGSLDERTQSTLAKALTSELGRLQGLVERERITISCDVALEEALAAVIDTARSQGTEITFAGGAALVHADAEGLAQVVQNLLVNARLYAPGSSVAIVAKNYAGRVVLLVSDDGAGISEHERLAVFARGSRGVASAGTVGDGLGLYMAARLMADMGGSIRLASDVARGACFVLELLAAVDPTPARASLFEGYASPVGAFA
jgi:signal transduction histidine kinase